MEADVAGCCYRPVIGLHAVARDGRDRTCGDRDPAHAVVVGVGQIEVARSVERERGWQVELGGCRRAAIAGEARLRPCPQSSQ